MGEQMKRRMWTQVGIIYEAEGRSSSLFRFPISDSRFSPFYAQGGVWFPTNGLQDEPA